MMEDRPQRKLEWIPIFEWPDFLYKKKWEPCPASRRHRAGTSPTTPDATVELD